MKQMEFMELKQKFVNLILEYELLQRKGSILENGYLLEFYELLEQQKYLEYENKYLIQAILMKTENKPLAEIEEYLESSKKEFNEIMNYFFRQYSTAKDLAQRMEQYNVKDIEAVDAVFREYCENFHPMLKGNATPNEMNLYEILIQLYRMGNIEGFKSFLEENRSMLTPITFNERDYVCISEIYEKSIKELTNTIQKQKTSFPFNREDLLQNQTNITQEHIKLRENNYNLREINKNLQKDFQLHFNFKFEL